MTPSGPKYRTSSVTSYKVKSIVRPIDESVYGSAHCAGGLSLPFFVDSFVLLVRCVGSGDGLTMEVHLVAAGSF